MSGPTIEYLSEADVLEIHQAVISQSGGSHGVLNLELLRSALDDIEDICHIAIKSYGRKKSK